MGNLALFDETEKYRYLLRRDLAPTRSFFETADRRMVICMLNPSTATAVKNDPTIRRCMALARREGCTVLDVLNVYAWRATDWTQLRQVEDPVGSDNDQHILATATAADVLVCAWGAHVQEIAGGVKRARDVAGLLRRAAKVPLLCLGTTNAGHPRHPLYVAKETPLVPWEGA